MRGIPRTNVLLALLVVGLAALLLGLQLLRARGSGPTMTREIQEMVAGLQAFLEVGPRTWLGPVASVRVPVRPGFWVTVALAGLAWVAWSLWRRAQQRSPSKRS